MLQHPKLLAQRLTRGARATGVALLAALVVLAGLAPQASAADTLVDLGTLPGGFTSVPGGINALGQVSGGAATSGVTADRAFVWDPSTGLVNIGTLGGNAYGNAITAAGTVAGHSALAGTLRFRDHAFRWTSALGMQDLGTLAGGTISRAYGISELEHIVGESNTLENGVLVFRAFLWTAGAGMQSLGTLLNGGSSIAFGVNSAGEVVGQADDASGFTRAFRWTQSGGMQDLGTLPGHVAAIARGINGGGQVAGWSEDAAGVRRAVVWDPVTGPRDLGTLPGGAESSAYGINDAGAVVGAASLADGSVHAVVWTPAGVIRDLGTLPGGSFSAAYGINAANQVVGQATTADEYDRAVRWQLDRPPVADGLSLATPQDTAVAVALTGSDPDGDSLSFVVLTPPAHGALGGTPPALTYTPAAGYSGPDSFTFKVTASGVDSPPATVSIAVSPVEPPPPGDDPAGRMKGQGMVDADSGRGAFELRLRTAAGAVEGFGRLEYRRGADRFVSTAVTEVVFADDPALAPGPLPVVDSARFSGEGLWNDQPGYTFEASATDAGEPGVGRDTFAVTIKSASGEVVATAGGALVAGNIQSARVFVQAGATAATKRR